MMLDTNFAVERMRLRSERDIVISWRRRQSHKFQICDPKSKRTDGSHGGRVYPFWRFCFGQRRAFTGTGRTSTNS